MPPLAAEADAIANILLFIPYGLFFYIQRFNDSTRNRFVKNILIITGWGFVLSILVEIAQLFSLSRNTSLMDVMMNTIGTLSGSILAVFTLKLNNNSAFYSKFLRLIYKPHITILIIYLLLILFAGLIPFNFTASPATLSVQIRQLLSIQTDVITHPSKIFSIIFLYTPLGYLAIRVLYLENKNYSFLRRITLALLACILFAFFILREAITASLIVGAVLVITGVYLTNRTSKVSTV